MHTNPTTAVNPSQSSVDALARWPDEGPICMVNLLAYAGETGRAAYGRYTAVAAQTVAAQGGSAIFMAPVIHSADAWDSVVLVYYPRRAAYLDMQTDPAYVGAIPDRTAGLSARLLYPFALPNVAPVPEVLGNGTEVFELELLRLTDPMDETPASGPAALDLPAGGPGLVTDSQWDQLRLTRYPSFDAWSAATEPGNGNGTEDSLRLVAQPGGAS